MPGVYVYDWTHASTSTSGAFRTLTTVAADGLAASSSPAGGRPSALKCRGRGAGVGRHLVEHGGDPRRRVARGTSRRPCSRGWSARWRRRLRPPARSTPIATSRSLDAERIAERGDGADQIQRRARRPPPSAAARSWRRASPPASPRGARPSPRRWPWASGTRPSADRTPPCPRRRAPAAARASRPAAPAASPAPRARRRCRGGCAAGRRPSAPAPRRRRRRSPTPMPPPGVGSGDATRSSTAVSDRSAGG